ncbi:MAG: CopD family protein [Alphaproteobacteria bacterium]|nr:CopD family protein [Alphaproteobacteria bacterium]
MDWDLWTITLNIARLAAYAGTIMAIGTALFLGLVGAPDDQRGAAIARTGLVAAAAGVLASIVTLPLQAGLLADANWRDTLDYYGVLVQEGAPPSVRLTAAFDGGSLGQVLTAPFGFSASVRVLSLVFLATLFWRPRAAPRNLLVLAACLGSASFVLQGHTTELETSLTIRIALFVHIAGIAFWAGGLTPVLQSLDTPDYDALATMLEQYTALAMILVPILLIAGIAMAVALLDSWDQTLTTDYGRVLLAKTGLVAAMLALGAVNRGLLTPALRGARSTVVPRLRITIMIELGIALLVLGASVILAATQLGDQI